MNLEPFSKIMYPGAHSVTYFVTYSVTCSGSVSGNSAEASVSAGVSCKRPGRKQPETLATNNITAPLPPHAS
jgi:hypothetical protein